jgi:hypothetical protein
MISCPQCRSGRIHRSRRKGFFERRILSLLFVRPFRCLSCDCRFFHWSFSPNPNPSRTVPTN